jgi:hypothetical protein
MSLEDKKSRQQRVQRYGEHSGGDYFIRAVEERKGRAESLPSSTESSERAASAKCLQFLLLTIFLWHKLLKRRK